MIICSKSRVQYFSEICIVYFLVSLENIKDVQCNIDQSRTGSVNSQERVPKLARHVNNFLVFLFVLLLEIFIF